MLQRLENWARHTTEARAVDVLQRPGKWAGLYKGQGSGRSITKPGQVSTALLRQWVLNYVEVKQSHEKGKIAGKLQERKA